jgi:hypothetical protein
LAAVGTLRMIYLKLDPFNKAFIVKQMVARGLSYSDGLLEFFETNATINLLIFALD